jgi:hypothetical protein
VTGFYKLIGNNAIKLRRTNAWTYVGFLDTFLLFRTHHLRNYITEVTLIVRKISYFKIHVNIRDFSIFCREATCQYRRPG